METKTTIRYKVEYTSAGWNTWHGVGSLTASLERARQQYVEWSVTYHNRWRTFYGLRRPITLHIRIIERTKETTTDQGDDFVKEIETNEVVERLILEVRE